MRPPRWVCQQVSLGALVQMLEQPSLRFLVYDTDQRPGAGIIADIDSTAHNLVHVLTSSQMAGADAEYVENDSIVHIAHFVPDTKMNALFRLARGTTEEEAMGAAMAVRAASHRASRAI